MRNYQKYSKPNNQHRNPKHLGPTKTPLTLEMLESRINPTDVISSSLLFRGDLIADGGLWKGTRTPIEVGFNPTGTEAFEDGFEAGLLHSPEFRG